MKTKIAEIAFDENAAILNIDILENAEMTTQNLRKHYHAIKKITKGKQYFAVVDIGHDYLIDIEATEYAASKEALENRLAAAYCNPSLANRVNIMLLQKTCKSSIPIQIFHTKKSGFNWVSNLKEDYENFTRKQGLVFVP